MKNYWIDKKHDLVAKAIAERFRVLVMQGVRELVEAEAEKISWTDRIDKDE